MSISSRVARPLLASIFIGGGLDAVRHPEGKVKVAEVVTKPLSSRIDVLPDDATTLVRINGGVQVVAGALLSLGKFRRLSALALIGSIIPTTYAGHRFWDELDEEKRQQQQVHFLKNLGILGGLILAATDTEGAPSTAWQLKRKARRAGAAVSRKKAAADRRSRRTLAKTSTAGNRAFHRMDDVALKEAARAADTASHLFSTGAEWTNALLSKAEEHLASA
jgi:putative oxidoreductase